MFGISCGGWHKPSAVLRECDKQDGRLDIDSKAAADNRGFSSLRALHHVRLLLEHSTKGNISVLPGVRQIMASHTASKLMLNAKYFGGLMLSYVAADRTNQFFALLAWQAWKRSEQF